MHWSVSESSPGTGKLLDEIGEFLAVAHGRYESRGSGLRGCRGVAHQIRLERSICAVWVVDAAFHRDDERANEKHKDWGIDHGGSWWNC